MDLITNFFIMNKTIIMTIGFAVILILLILIFTKILSRRKQHKEITQAAADRVRDENLNSVILNNYGNGGKHKEVYVPYDVDYSNSESRKNGSTSVVDIATKQTMIQLIEKTELSTRKFILNPSKKIRIGSDLQDNDISIFVDGIAPHQCEIFLVEDKVYIRNLSNTMQTVLRRKKEKAYVDAKGIRLLSNDIIILGKVVYEIMIIS